LTCKFFWKYWESCT